MKRTIYQLDGMLYRDEQYDWRVGPEDLLDLIDRVSKECGPRPLVTITIEVKE